MAKYLLTNEAYSQLEKIEKRSLENFGEANTKKYMADIYKGFQKAADTPNRDDARTKRSNPFSMQPAGKNHFAVYNRFDEYIIIGAVFGQEMNIEHEIAKTKARVSDSIEQVRKRLEVQKTDKNRQQI